MTAKHAHIFTRLRSFIDGYVSFTNPDYSLVGAVWTASTYLWPQFDAFPYLAITAATKRAGKTRFSEVLTTICSNPKNAAAMTASGIFRSIKEDKPTLFIDEAESMSGGAADALRSVLNVGYRQGQCIVRQGKGGVPEEFPTYCPKVFILIGDVYDTLRDRCITFRMQRGEVTRRFLFSEATAEGNALGAELKELIDERSGEIISVYMSMPMMKFLNDRDAELWMPLFAVCQVLAPEMMGDLTRAAVDMSTEKTQPARKHTTLVGAEGDALDQEYGIRLLHDVAAVMAALPARQKGIHSAELLDALKALPTGPWRKFKSDEGLTPMNMADLLKVFGLVPVPVRVGGKVPRANGQPNVLRGYRKDEVLAAAKLHKTIIG